MPDTAMFVPIETLSPDAWQRRLPRAKVYRRHELILNLAHHKRVLHLGATDAPMTQRKLAQGRLLHVQLRPVCKTLVGLDVDSVSAKHIVDQTGIEDIVIADMTALDIHKTDERLQQPFDVILCCDLIEHVANAGALLQNLVPFCQPQTQVLFTTPNALAIRATVRTMVQAKETVHPDHVAYYSCSTLARLLQQHGFTPLAYAPYADPPTNPLAGKLLAPLFKLLPHSADGLTLLARYSG